MKHYAYVVMFYVDGANIIKMQTSTISTLGALILTCVKQIYITGWYLHAYKSM